MSLIGLQIYLTLKFNFLIPKKKASLFSILLGLSIPEIDIIFILINNIFLNVQNKISLFDKSLTHSIVTIGVLYLLFLIIYEIKKNQSILKFANGIAFGMILNIFFDIILRLGNMDIFWPLPIGTVYKYSYSSITFNSLLCMEFIFFRLISYEFINMILKKGLVNNYIKYLSIWMKIEGVFILIFIISIIFFSNSIIQIFSLLYFLCYLGTLISILNLKKIIN